MTDADSDNSAGVYDIDWAGATERLTAAAATEADWYAGLAAGLVHSDDRRAVDVGCGGGGMTLALARALPATGEVLAVDGEQALLDAVRDMLAGAAGVRCPVRLVRASLDDRAELTGRVGGDVDLVWASAVVHHAGDQQATLDALARLLRAGGRLAIAEGGLPAQRMPWDVGVGAPGLEDRLVAANNRWFVGMRAQLPGTRRMPYGWRTALERAGLVDVRTRSTVFERPAPLSPDDRHDAVARLGHRVEALRNAELLDADDLAAWDRLLDPDDQCWLGARDDLHLLEARSVHVGTRRAHPK